MECVRVKAKFPEHVPFYIARMVMHDYVVDSLEEFKVAPTDEQLQHYITRRYKEDECILPYCTLVTLTVQEAMNTVSSRSMATYQAPIKKRKLTTTERKDIKKFKSVHIPPNAFCEICQYDIKRGLYTLPCGCMFHGKCIRKALEYQARCPLCYKDVF